ncbi:antibiotic biosynthesis monooxygenase family protein [Pigmentiphaga kullae]|uniref:Heme-degrading monooxygenase HmoA n=1 Tax=Pigmentiphaga kullae TaxID=151784 RepID=A0A4Q7NLZ3_9BURK|nr:antibiotic biosynthesis monooxygenase family protein [Pigmentiphaga kullae]RZS86012.1 heme-degrading monooxygenase HmoA [Pigmentiphaga kullae]
MIYELAHIEIQPGTQEKFEAGVQEAAPLFQRAKGCHGMELHQTLEDPNAYLLVVQWETLEDHTVHFRGSEDFQAWRALVGGYFAKPPEVRHATTVAKPF